MLKFVLGTVKRKLSLTTGTGRGMIYSDELFSKMCAEKIGRPGTSLDIAAHSLLHLLPLLDSHCGEEAIDALVIYECSGA
jgi:hypothetical protein